MGKRRRCDGRRRWDWLPTVRIYGICREPQEEVNAIAGRRSLWRRCAKRVDSDADMEACRAGAASLRDSPAKCDIAERAELGLRRL